METAAHPRFLFKPRTFGMIIVTLTSSASLWTGVVKTFRWASQIIGTSSEFVFSIPAKFADGQAFANFLIHDLGLSLNPPTTECSFWSGQHLGFRLDFTPDHQQYDNSVYVNDGQNINFADHRSSIGLTGNGAIRVALVPMMLNIAMSICFFHECGGYLLDDDGELLSHFEWNPSKSLFWDVREGVPFPPTEIRTVYRF